MQIGALMDAETWMTADETVENGFAEKVITPEGNDADVAANFGPMLAIFRKVPAADRGPLRRFDIAHQARRRREPDLGMLYLCGR